MHILAAVSGHREGTADMARKTKEEALETRNSRPSA